MFFLSSSHATSQFYNWNVFLFMNDEDFLVSNGNIYFIFMYWNMFLLLFRISSYYIFYFECSFPKEEVENRGKNLEVNKCCIICMTQHKSEVLLP